MLALLGANDVIFAQAGADAFRRDVKDFVVDFCRLGESVKPVGCMIVMSPVE